MNNWISKFVECFWKNAINFFIGFWLIFIESYVRCKSSIIYVSIKWKPHTYTRNTIFTLNRFGVECVQEETQMKKKNNVQTWWSRTHKKVMKCRFCYFHAFIFSPSHVANLIYTMSTFCQTNASSIYLLFHHSNADVFKWFLWHYIMHIHIHEFTITHTYTQFVVMHFRWLSQKVE